VSGCGSEEKNLVMYGIFWLRKRHKINYNDEEDVL
jgi:hypothetical protein